MLPLVEDSMTAMARREAQLAFRWQTDFGNIGPTTPTGDPVAVSEYLRHKYAHYFLAAFDTNNKIHCTKLYCLNLFVGGDRFPACSVPAAIMPGATSLANQLLGISTGAQNCIRFLHEHTQKCTKAQSVAILPFTVVMCSPYNALTTVCRGYQVSWCQVRGLAIEQTIQMAGNVIKLFKKCQKNPPVLLS